MNVSCPECRTVYRVDPAKVPSAGVRARCVRCPRVFEVSTTEPRPAAARAGGQALADREAEAGVAAEEAVTASDAEVSSPSFDPAAEYGREDGAPGDAVAKTADQEETASQAAEWEEGRVEAEQPPSGYQPSVETPSAAPLPQFESPGTTEERLPPAPFGSADPKARARRLARALVSDIVVYHPERRERSLRQGTIRQDFRDEIRKSWDEYVAQVGNDMARETSYFQEALNEILAGGSRIF
jgi:predicted Zn finger-like uncharacterized protein